MEKDFLIVKDRLPELTVRAIGFDHETTTLETTLKNKFFEKTTYRERKILEFRVDGYLGWWVYYRDSRQIVLNITDSNYQSHTTYETREEIINYLKSEDEADEIDRKDPRVSFYKGYVGWVKRFKLNEILKICEGAE